MEKKTSLKKELEQMNIGDTREYPIIRTMSIRSMASTVSLQLDRIYKTTTCRETKTITITRTA